MVCVCIDGAIVEGRDNEGLMDGDDDGGGWEVEDDELELPADMVRPVQLCSASCDVR